jgi:periplasmic copper chaperone A
MTFSARQLVVDHPARSVTTRRGECVAMSPRRRPARTTRRRRGPVAVAATVLGVLLLTGPAALAHVTISPSVAPTGSTTELTFRVPNEEAAAATTRLTVQIPADHPIAQLLVKPVPGWTTTVHTTRLEKPLVTDDGTFHSVVSLVTWTGGRIEPGQYQDFSLSVDPLPDTPTTLVFKALQGYSNGDVVRWIDVPQQGQGEPEHPAPTLQVVAAGSASAASDSDTDAMAGMPDNGATSDASDGDSSGGVVAWIALVVAVVAAAIAGGAYARTRRTP